MIIEVKCNGNTLLKLDVWSMVIMALFSRARTVKNLNTLQVFCDDVEQPKPDTWDMDT